MPFWIAPLLIAPFVGSFLGVLIRRLPAGRPIVLSRSACETCGHVLAIRDLVPLLSFVTLCARCRMCGVRIATDHFAIEVAALAVAMCSVLTQSDATRVWVGCILGWSLLTLAWIDWKHMRLPDVLTLPLIVLGLLATVMVEPGAITDHAAAAALAYLSFRAISRGYRLLRGREGLGEGDAKLLAASGAWVGLRLLPEIVLAGALIGICMAAARMPLRRWPRRDMRIAFGPSLALATWLVWIMGS